MKIKYPNCFNKGDIITMEVNFIKGIISYYINDNSIGISFRDIIQNENIKYKFFVQIWGQNDSFSIIDYSERKE